MKKYVKILFIILLSSNIAYSHPIIGGDLLIKNTSQQNYEFTLFLYTPYIFLENITLPINFGDNTFGKLTLIETSDLPNNIRKYITNTIIITTL